MIVLFLLWIQAVLGLVVTPRVCVSPCQAEAQVYITPNPENVTLIVELDGPKYRRSIVDLDGTVEETTQHSFYYPDLPEGEYEIRVALYRGRTKFSPGFPNMTAFETSTITVR